MDITIYTLCYNEEIILPKFISHYRERFPNCKIVIYDNESTDSSMEIAKENDCEVRTYSTNNKINDLKYLEIKNNCWKDSETDWNFVGDIDEFCQISLNDLEIENENNTSHIQFTNYDMINLSDNPEDIKIDELEFGFRNQNNDKILIFNKKFIKKINYSPGCHVAKPIGKLKKQIKRYDLFHYKYIGQNYLIERYKNFSSRLSSDNQKYGWGFHYKTNEEKIKKLFINKKTIAKKLK